MHALRQDAATLACDPSPQVQMHAPAQDAAALACGLSSQVQMHAPVQNAAALASGHSGRSRLPPAVNPPGACSTWSAENGSMKKTEDRSALRMSLF